MSNINNVLKNKENVVNDFLNKNISLELLIEKELYRENLKVNLKEL